MADWQHRTSFVAPYVACIRSYASNLIQAHEFGTPFGFDNEPWGPRYQRQAVKIYSETLPIDYLERFGSVFAGCALVMDAQPDTPTALEADWVIVRSYFVNAARAIAATFDLGVDVDTYWEDPIDRDATVPGVARFDLLAELVSPEGASQLLQAGGNVAEHLRMHTTREPLEQHHLNILRDLASGVPANVVAETHGFSRSGYYRETREIFRILGVENRQQAVALAAEQHWL